ncbi:hypothetical protein ACOSQ4_008331 [Xanthoceras sorbifolium]
MTTFKMEVATQLSDQTAQLEYRMQEMLTAVFKEARPEGMSGNGKGILGSAPAVPTADPRNARTAGEHRFTNNQGSSSQVFSDSLVKIPKLTFPKFDGTDPKTWLRKCDRYFLIHPVPPDQKVLIASIHFEKKAEVWFQSYYDLQEGVSWREFKESLLTRFLDVEQEDVIGELYRLRQTGTVSEYQDKFEELQPRLRAKGYGLGEGFFLESFLSGLKSEIKNQVKMFSPSDLKTAIHLARLLEAAIEPKRNRPWVQKTNIYNSSTITPNQTLAKTHNTYQNTHPTSINTALKPTEPIPIKRLTQAEMKTRRDKGLCYNCDEPYTYGHQCTKKRLYMLMGEDEEDQEIDTEIEEVQEEFVPEICKEEMSISHHALTGCAGLQTIRLRGKVKHREITILVDSGSTHNFLDPNTAQLTGVEIEETETLWVTVGGGGKISSKAKCKEFTWAMQGVTFSTEMRLLTLGGCDAVLGMQWIREIGPIMLDAKQLSMSFMKEGKWVSLQGIRTESKLSQLTGKKVGNQLEKAHNQAEAVVQLYSLETEEKMVEIPTVLKPLLEEYAEVFSEPKSLPPHRKQDHKIPLIAGCSPVNVRNYRHPYVQKNEIERIVREMLDSGIIRHSNSPFSSPILLVKKKDGTWRFCLDYRELNKITVKDKFPIPLIDELLDELNGARVFTKLDLRAGYHQIRVAEADIPKTAFRTHQGHYEFKVMPFGLTNAPASFQSLMNEIFRPYLRKMILVFFDDILVYSHNILEHQEHLRITFSILRENQLFVKKSKCSFGCHELEYLGHIISEKGVAADNKKIQGMVDWPTPKSIKALRGFLGLTGYYRKFVRGYGIISKPLTNLLRKGGFIWNEEAEMAFQNLKVAMTTTPVLALPDFQQPFVLETDACDTGIGVVLMQQDRPIAYISKSLPNRKKGLSTYEKELLAIVYAVQKWRAYLHGNRFTIKTDHHSLKYFLEQKITTLMQQKWLTKLLGYDYVISYKKGKENVVADGLSRAFQEEEEPSYLALTATKPAWVQEVIESYYKDPKATALIPELLIGSQANQEFTMKEGILRKNGVIYVGSYGNLRQKLIEEAHSSAMGGHSGIQGTMKRLQLYFFWDSMLKEVSARVLECTVCQENKSLHSKPAGLLQPLPIPNTPWLDIAMDFIEGLPRSAGKDTILVVIDRLTKYAHFLALTHPYTAQQVARLFLDNIQKLHGIPSTIVSDRDKIFTSQFWQHLFKAMGTQLCLSTAYHPQTDGQSERLNQCLENYLRCMTSSKPSHWANWLPLAEWWYNTNYHTALKMTPFEALYGFRPPIYSGSPRDYSDPENRAFVIDRNRIQHTLKESLTQAQSRMKTYADRKRTEREFNTGDHVYLKLQPYRQSTLAVRRTLKLAPRYFGPYQITERVGKVAYRLLLPPGSQIHPVFHVSQLKAKIGSRFTSNPQLPHAGPDGQILAQPVAVLERKMVKKHNKAVVQYLIQWSTTSPEDATWEDAEMIRKSFPSFDP